MDLLYNSVGEFGSQSKRFALYYKAIDLKAILLKFMIKVKRIYEFVTAVPCLGTRKKRKR